MLTQKRIVEFARWLAVLPVAFLARHAAYVVAGSLGYLLFNWLDREGAGRWARHLIWGTPPAMAFVIAGAKTAPRFRRVSAVALAILAVALAALIHDVLWDGIHGDFLPVITETVAVAAGVAFVFSSERSKGPSQTPAPPSESQVTRPSLPPHRQTQ